MESIAEGGAALLWSATKIGVLDSEYPGSQRINPLYLEECVTIYYSTGCQIG
jgi:hypothetical protein